MNKKETAEKIFSLLNLLSNYIEYGYLKNNDIPDFSFFIQSKTDEIIKKYQEKKPVDINKKRNLVSLAEKIQICKDCSPQYKRIYGIGNVDAQIMVVTLPPGTEEIKLEKPLNIESASFFKKWLASISIDLNDVFITNIIKCNFLNNKLLKNNIESCLQIFNEELEIIKPKIILALGQLTISSLRKEYTNLSKFHGTLLSYKNIPVIPTYHPDEVLKNTDLKKVVWEDLKKFKKAFGETS